MSASASASVKAALAAKRAEARASRSRSVSPVKRPGSGFNSSNPASASPSPMKPRGLFGTSRDSSLDESGEPSHQGEGEEGQGEEEGEGDVSGFTQVALHVLLNKACQKGKLNIGARAPALESLPTEVWSLADDSEPAWHDRKQTDQAWWERAELAVLQAGGNAISSIDDKLGEFRGLTRLEVSGGSFVSSDQQLRLARRSQLPSLPVRKLKRNLLTSLPDSLVNLWSLTHLNLSGNSLTSFPTCLLCLDKLVSLDLSDNRLSALWRNDTVSAARTEQKQRKLEWEREHGPVDGAEENGLWAGLSPSKKTQAQARAAKARVLPQTMPLHALQTLRLRGNRLDNASLGLGGSSGSKEEDFAFPANLTLLDLAQNPLRGPIDVSLFAELDQLQELDLSETGVPDQVFGGSSTGPTKVLPSLALLHLSKCDIDDLAPLEKAFGSGITQDQGMSTPDDSRPASASLLTRKQLIKVQGSPSLATGAGDLHVVLAGCPLREEQRRRKRGPTHKPLPVLGHSSSGGTETGRTEWPALGARSNTRASPSKEAIRQSSGFAPTGGYHGSPGHGLPPSAGTANPGNGSKLGLTSPVPASALTFTSPDSSTILSSPRTGASGPFAAPSSTSSVDTVQRQLENTSLNAPGQKEAWELQADAGLLTEGGKRRLRAEQARRQRELELLQQQQGGGDLDQQATSPRKQQSQLATSEHFLDSGEMEAIGGSALANAKLSTKKKEALSQVPCKFFRSHGCSAGSACPFAHTMAGGGSQKATCQWFLKGNCRFGHKCALAHILPGQPISVSAIAGGL